MASFTVEDMRVQSETVRWCTIIRNVQQNPFLNEARRNEVAAKEKQGHNHGKDLELGFPEEWEYAGEVDVAHEKTNNASNAKHAGCPSVPRSLG